MHHFNEKFLRRAANGIRRRTVGERHIILFYKLRSILKKSRFDVWCFPHCPKSYGYTIEKVLAELGLAVVAQRTENTVLGLILEDATTNPLYTVNDDLRLLNARCTDISKSKVERVFEEVFKYPLAIDPLRYRGKAVSKSDINAAHDGRVIECPISQREPGRVYEVLVENSVEAGVVEDIRITVVGGSLPVAYLKRRFVYQRFADTNFRSQLVDVKDVTSADERELILKFARAMGLDFGDLDTLRDRVTGRFYIVDANKTPTGPPAALWFLSRTKAVKRIAEAFRLEFLEYPFSTSVSYEG